LPPRGDAAFGRYGPTVSVCGQPDTVCVRSKLRGAACKCVCVCARARARVRACVRACVRVRACVCVRACVRMCVCVRARVRAWLPASVGPAQASPASRGPAPAAFKAPSLPSPSRQIGPRTEPGSQHHWGQSRPPQRLHPEERRGLGSGGLQPRRANEVKFHSNTAMKKHFIHSPGLQCLTPGAARASCRP
jgi:hypothetical protein